MNKELELWRFISSRLYDGERVILLVVAESSGSSPGRAGYKMAVGSNGELVGSIGGGVMEVGLVEQAKSLLSEPGAVATGFRGSKVIEQVHQKNSPNASGMICSGRQTVVIRKLGPGDLATVEAIVKSLQRKKPRAFEISNLKFQIVDNTRDGSSCYFLKTSETEFVYQEKLGAKNELYIVGGGHCALALSEIAANLDFRVSIFDDRPELNTLEKNDFAHDIAVVDGYERIGEMIPDGENVYVVVMTLGYKFDEIVIRALAGRNFKYFGVLGSKAKMATLMNTLRNDGFPADWLAGIRTPIGLPINSHSPEEIAVSIAAEIIAVKNSEN